MPLLSFQSCDVVAGLLLLSWAHFGDNNEAGIELRFHTTLTTDSSSRLWMFTGMSLRIAQELGLHQQGTSIGTGIS